MWKLTIEDDEGKQTSLPLAHDEYGLGRAEANAIRLTDRNVSRKHAILRRNGAGWVITDLSSYNGTFVNGMRVAGEQLINNGDVIQLGDYRLELVDESVVTQPTGVDATTGPVPVHQRPDRLVVVIGPTPGAEYPLDREYFTIGRAEDATISINHSSVSRFHAELIALGNGRYEIVDKGSANGIRINGVELKRGILEAGDALELGDVRLRFVGAGKIFRPGIDQSQQLPAVVGAFESVAPSVRAPMPSGRAATVGKVIAAGFVIGLMLVMAAVYAMRQNARSMPQPQVAPAEASGSDRGSKLLEDATARLAAGDVEGAHKKVLEIADTAPERDSPAFKDIEDKWAQSVLAAADGASDSGEKRRLLNDLAATPTVSADRRTEAAKRIEELDAQPQPQSPSPQPQRTARPGAPPPTGAVGSEPATSPASAVTAAPANAGFAVPPGISDDEVRNRRRIEPLVANGKASVDDLRLLIAICKHWHDDGCKQRAQALLTKKQGSP